MDLSAGICRKKFATARFSTPVEVSLRAERIAELNTLSKALVDSLGIHSVTAQVLVGRGVSGVEEARRFLSPTLKNDMPDPFQVKNIREAGELLIEAIESKKRITVFSDFDVDGLSSASQLVLFLYALGADVTNYTPNRFTEGYGVTQEAVRRLAEQGTEVLVTVDCGISSCAELSLARALGLQTIVIDHHIPHELPTADVIVDPAQEGCPFGEYKLAAAGLVWVLLIVIRSLLRESDAEFPEPPDPKDFLDLAALGTICDMVPLTKLNRVIAYRGVEALRKTERPGLVALKDVSGAGGGKRITSGHVAFGLGPRINAAGRLGDAGDVFRLLTTEDFGRAKALAEAIDRSNTKRRAIEEGVLDSCFERLAKDESLLKKPAIALFGEGYHIGVVGIVAQRLIENFFRPVALMAPGERDGEPVVRGSVRGIRGFHVADALQSIGELLLNHGGHEAAGGFSLKRENVESFSEAFIAEAERRLTEEMLRRHRTADVEVKLSDIDYKVVDELSKLSPFGVGNPSPLLIAKGVTIEGITVLSNGHIRMRLGDGRYYVNAVAWSYQGHPLIQKGKKVNVAFYPEINTYKGISSVQLNIQELWE